MKVNEFIENIENFVVELRTNLANGKLNNDAEVEVYFKRIDDGYLVIGSPINFLQLEPLTEFIKDYAINDAQDNDELENCDLDGEEWEAYTIDSEMLKNAKAGNTVAIICEGD